MRAPRRAAFSPWKAAGPRQCTGSRARRCAGSDRHSHTALRAQRSAPELEHFVKLLGRSDVRPVDKVAARVDEERRNAEVGRGSALRRSAACNSVSPRCAALRSRERQHTTVEKCPSATSIWRRSLHGRSAEAVLRMKSKVPRCFSRSLGSCSAATAASRQRRQRLLAPCAPGRARCPFRPGPW
jgi:hypothetical protein